LQDQGDAFDLGQLAAQPFDDAVGADFALLERFQRNEYAAIVNCELPAAPMNEPRVALPISSTMLATRRCNSTMAEWKCPAGRIGVDDHTGILLGRESLGTCW